MKLHSGDTALNISLKDWEELANFTAGYSGSDLAALTLGALFEPIRDLQQASHWVKLAGIVCCLTVQLFIFYSKIKHTFKTMIVNEKCNFNIKEKVVIFSIKTLCYLQPSLNTLINKKDFHE